MARPAPVQRRDPRGALAKSPPGRGLALTVYSAVVLSAWLGLSYALAALLGDWAQLHFWLFVSVWALCAMILGPAVAWALRVPVWVFERDVVDSESLALPAGLSEPLRELTRDARTLLLTLESRSIDVESIATDLWRWTQDIDALQESDRAVLKLLGLSAAPIRAMLRPSWDGRTASLADSAASRVQVVDTLRRFEAALIRHHPAPYR